MYYLFVLFILFFTLIFLSYIQGMEFSFFDFTLTSLHLIACIGISMYGMFVLYYRKEKENFKSKLEMMQLSALHILGTFSLFFIGMYPILVFLQFLYPFLLLKKNNALTFGIFLYMQHMILSTLFISESYLFYFIYLASLGFFLWMRKIYFYQISLWKYSLVIATITSFVFFTERFLFDLYVWSALEAKSYHFDSNVFYLLTIIHILIIFIIKHKKPIGFKKN